MMGKHDWRRRGCDPEKSSISLKALNNRERKIGRAHKMETKRIWQLERDQRKGRGERETHSQRTTTGWMRLSHRPIRGGCDEKGGYKKEETRKKTVLSRHTDRHRHTQERERERNQPLEKPDNRWMYSVVQRERVQSESATTKPNREREAIIVTGNSRELKQRSRLYFLPFFFFFFFLVFLVFSFLVNVYVCMNKKR